VPDAVGKQEKLAPESGVKFMAPVSGASFWSVCTRLKTIFHPRIQPLAERLALFQ